MKIIQNKYGLHFVLLIAFLLAFWLQGPRLFNPYAVEEDFRRHHWMDGFDDADIYEEDPAVGSFVFRMETPLGTFVMDRRSPLYGLIFQLGGKIAPIVLISKLLVFPLLLTATYYAYRIGELARGRKVALALALAFIVINLASNTMSSTIGGLQRSFTAPLCLALIYYLMRKMDWRAALVIAISGLIYAPVFVIGVLMYGLGLVERRNGRWTVAWRRLLPLSLAIAVVTLFLLPLLLGQSGASAATAGGDRWAFLADPALQPDGRHALFSYFPLMGHGGLTLKGVDIIHTILFFSFLIVFWLLDRRSLVALPAALKHFLFASVLGFAIAWLVALAASSFILYFPSRYTQATLLLFGLLAFMLNVGEMTALAAARIRQRRGELHKLVLPVALLGLGLVVFLPEADGTLGVGRGNTSRYLILALSLSLLGLTFVLRRRAPAPASQAAPGPAPRLVTALSIGLFGLSLLYLNFIQWPFYVATAEEIELFHYLEQVPADTLLAGSPCVLDSVPMFADRNVLFSCEQIHPDNGVMIEAMAAYYSDRPDELANFCTHYGIDYLVVNRGDFGERLLQSGDYLFEPIDGAIRPAVQSHTTFVLRDLPVEYQLFSAGKYYVASCDSFTALAAAH